MEYKVLRQLTITLQNTPGRLAGVTEALATEGINIDALSITDDAELGAVRLVVSDPSACRQMIQRRGLSVIETDVILAELTDGPGRMAKIARALADAKVNIDYGYATTLRVGEKTHLILRVSPLDKAKQVLDALKF
jgi:hypothetical protein